MAKFSKIIHENNENFLIKKFMGLFIQNLNKRLRIANRFSFVLTGGKSPIRLYNYLAKEKNIPWGKIDFFMGDERHVKENSEHSNIKMCKKHLLNKIKISDNQIYNISTRQVLIDDAIHYDVKIKNYFLRKRNKKVVFDLILLGIGQDGHIASLFKNTSYMNTKPDKLDHNVEMALRKDFSRITLNIRCINNSRTIFLWAPGKQKLNIVKKILSDNKFKYPASFLRKKNNFLFHCN